MAKKKSRKPTSKVKRKAGNLAAKPRQDTKGSNKSAEAKYQARKPNRSATVRRYSHNDPSLRTGKGGLTVWKLKKMAQRNQFKELDDLFNNGLTMDALPVGLAAGTGVPMLNFGSNIIRRVLDSLTVHSKYFKVESKQLVDDALGYLVGKNWRGKVFFPSHNRKVSEGRNRIRKFLKLPHSPIVPMARFDTMLLDRDPLAPDATSNVVVLNYARPQTRPYWQEIVLSKVQVYDVQVAVRGKYGPIFLGKTWLGRYDEKGQFTAFNPEQLVARYFLDFNDGAIKQQRKKHWDGSDEEFIDPMPHVEN